VVDHILGIKFVPNFLLMALEAIEKSHDLKALSAFNPFLAR